MTDVVVLRFLERLLADRARGDERSLSEYLPEGREHQAVVARTYLAVTEGGASERGGFSDDQAEAEGSAEFAGRYRIERELGRGGQGVVYLAQDLRLGRPVAIKRLHAELAFSRSRRMRLEREAQVLSRLDDPAFCRVLDVGLDDGDPYIVMDYVEGVSLGALIARAGAVEAERAEQESPLACGPAAEVEPLVSFFARCARALGTAHAVQVIHRDVKPSNILVAKGGEPVLVDFGLARDASSDDPTLTRDALGTLRYMAPERLDGRQGKAGAASDVWSLGVALYEALTLRHPLDGATHAQLAAAVVGGSVRPARKVRPDLARDLSLILDTALARDPKRRYATATNLADDLDRFLRSEPIHARAPSLAYRATKFASRHRRLAVGALVSTPVLIVASMNWRGAVVSGAEARGEVVELEHVQEELKNALRRERDLGLKLVQGITFEGDFASQNVTREQLLSQVQRFEDLATGYIDGLGGEVGPEIELYVTVIEAARAKREDRFDEALRMLDDKVMERVQAPEYRALLRGARITRAACLANLGRFREGIEVCDRLIESDPENPSYYNNRGLFLARLGEREAAKADLTRAIDLDPSLNMYYLARAQIRAQSNDPEGALDDYAAALELVPDDAISRYNRGVLLGNFGRAAEALVEHDLCLALQPDFAKAHEGRATNLLRLQRPQEALQSAERALELNHKSADAHYLFGAASSSLGDHEGALRGASACVELKPSHAEAHMNRGFALDRLSREDEAIEAFSRVLELRPNDSRAVRSRGACYFELERWDDVIAEMTRALELSPESLLARVYRGAAYSEVGRTEAALLDLDHALAQQPETPEALFHRARTLQRRGDYAAGLADVKRLLDLSPDYEGARELEAALAAETAPAGG